MWKAAILNNDDMDIITKLQKIQHLHDIMKVDCIYVLF